MRTVEVLALRSILMGIYGRGLKVTKAFLPIQKILTLGVKDTAR